MMNNRDKLLRQARRTKREIDWSAYKRKRNFVTNLIKRKKHEYYNKLLNENMTKPDKLWKVIKSAFPNNKTSDTIATSFIIDDSETTDKNVIVNGFCKYFSSVASKLKSKAFPLNNCVWKFLQPQVNNTGRQFRFKMVDGVEILKLLRNIKRRDATLPALAGFPTSDKLEMADSGL